MIRRLLHRLPQVASALALAAALAVIGAAPASAEPTAFVQADGKRLVGPDGETFAIRGINLGNWMTPEGYMFKFKRARSPREIETLIERLVGPEDAARFWDAFRANYITEEDIRFIAAAGFNTVRVPLHYKLFVDPKDPMRFEGSGYALIDRLLGWCRAAGLKVIVDMHAAPGGQTGVNHDDGPGYPLMFYVPALKRQTIALWAHLAARYADEPALLGYDLLNEPISPYHDTDVLNPQLEPFYEKATAAIRAVDPNHLIFLEGAQWGTRFAAFGPPFAKNLVYTYHKFWASTERDAVQEYVNFMNQYDVPVLVGETGEFTDSWNDGFRRLNERFGIGWSFWTYKNLDSSSTVVSARRPPGWDALEAVAMLPPEDWAGAALPPRADAKATLWAYLEAIRLGNADVNASYLASLGVKDPRAPVPQN